MSNVYIPHYARLFGVSTCTCWEIIYVYNKYLIDKKSSLVIFIFRFIDFQTELFSVCYLVERKIYEANKFYTAIWDDVVNFTDWCWWKTNRIGTVHHEAINIIHQGCMKCGWVINSFIFMLLFWFQPKYISRKLDFWIKTINTKVKLKTWEIISN